MIFFYICAVFSRRISQAQGRFYKLTLTDCETIFEFNLFVSEGV